MTNFDGTLVQIAYAVDDAEQAAHEFARCYGAGPFFVRRNRIVDAVGPDGRLGAFDHTSAYGQWNTIQVELVQTHHAAPDAFAATTAARGRLHHVAMLVASFDDAQRLLTDSGRPPLLTARTGSGNAFAFHDARASLGHLIEVYEPRPSLLALYDSVRTAAQGWDGTDPVRSF